MGLTKEQATRYGRHLILPEVGARGQEKLLNAKVLIVGAGGLGCPAGMYLAAAGIGTIGLVDGDVVETSNLQRQIAHNIYSIGAMKVDSARATLVALNPDVDVVSIRKRLTEDNAAGIIGPYDIVVDCTDNFATRYLINDVCVVLGKPLVSGAIIRFEGQVTTILPGRGHCYRCLYEELPPEGFAPSCSEAGILGAIPGVIGSLQATEVIKLVLGKGKPLTDSLLVYNALSAEFRRVRTRRNPECPSCGDGPRVAIESTLETVLCSVRST